MNFMVYLDISQTPSNCYPSQIYALQTILYLIAFGLTSVNKVLFKVRCLLEMEIEKKATQIKQK